MGRRSSTYGRRGGHGDETISKAYTYRQVAQIGGLWRSGEACLTDAAKRALLLESRFDLAYNAAHSLALARQLLQKLQQLPPGSTAGR